ncbi:hypothetical protein TNCV_2710001 [Trichonephila clavipes]|nr:hypothetical protein TNCV_2710001 [Trichonephila clavipes]
MSKKRETKWFLLTKASLIWDSKNTRLSQEWIGPCGIHSAEEKYTFLSLKHTLNEYLPCVQRSCRSSSSEQWDGNSEDLFSPLARLKDWNHNGFSPAGGKAILLSNSVEQKKMLAIESGFR